MQNFDDMTINAVRDTNDSKSVPPFTRYVTVYGERITLEIDSGSGVTLLNEETYERLKKRHKALALNKADLKLLTYTGNQITALGQIILPVKFRNCNKTSKAYVVSGHGPNLLGRCWMQELGVSIPQVHAANTSAPMPDDIAAILQELSSVFEPGLGKYNGPQVHLDVEVSATPTFCKARQIPFALREKVDAEIDRLVKEGIYVPTSYSKWTTPLVPVLKPNGQVRLCGDYKCTVNHAAKRDIYPMPTVEEIFSKLADSSLFYKIDLSQAFQQLTLAEKSQGSVTYAHFHIVHAATDFVKGWYKL